ncbi:MAG: hemerythrin-like domain-containing protein [Roseivirga sp.]|jgi:hemerythrin-like domain-containing protein
MRRHESLIPLSQFHRSCLFLALIAKENAPNVKGYPTIIEDKIDFSINFYQTQLTQHFEQEAKLWNYLRDKSKRLTVILDDLRLEREVLKTRFIQLMDSKSKEDLFQIGSLLEQHVRKEERILFQQIQSDLNEEELSQITRLTT